VGRGWSGGVIISLDPGVKLTGWAQWDPFGKLLHAGLIDTDHESFTRFVQYQADHGIFVEEIVCEFPQVYARSKSKGDPNDLLKLAAVIGAFSTTRVPFTTVLPHQWKGECPKAVTKNRALETLTAEELERIELPSARSLHHNVYDAVGIGLWYLKKKGIRNA
jgi:hypothetical protein